MKITVYTLPDCVQCDHTKRQLDRMAVPYEVIDLSSDERALAYVQSLGYASAPVVVAGDHHWSGFRLEQLKGLVTGVRRDH